MYSKVCQIDCLLQTPSSLFWEVETDGGHKEVDDAGGCPTSTRIVASPAERNPCHVSNWIGLRDNPYGLDRRERSTSPNIGKWRPAQPTYVASLIVADDATVYVSRRTVPFFAL
jgi:hypothetical protein